MKKPTILIGSLYLVSIILFFGVIFSLNHVNATLKNNFLQASEVSSNPELTKRFLSQVSSGQLSTTDYVKIFNLNFEVERAGVARAHSLIDLINSLKELLASIVILQLLLLTLFVKYSKKN